MWVDFVGRAWALRTPLRWAQDTTVPARCHACLGSRTRPAVSCPQRPRLLRHLQGSVRLRPARSAGGRLAHHRGAHSPPSMTASDAALPSPLGVPCSRDIPTLKL